MPTIEQFGGIVPRKPWHLLEKGEATVAHNVKLRSGKIEAWRERLPLGLAVEDALTVYYRGCCALSWDSCVSVAEYVTDFGRFYLTGRESYPEVAWLKGCTPEYLPLGVPAPTQPVHVSAAETIGRDCASRSYLCTFVNIFGEESAPSPVSLAVTVKDGSPVTVTGIPQPPEGYGIQEVWLYRTATAYRDDRSKEQEIQTDYLKVAEIPIGQTTYTDTVMDKGLGRVCNTREVRMPPTDLRHISHIKGTGTLVGVTGNEVHFSENMQPYNWPAEYDLTLPHNIVNMVTVNNQVFVSTDGYPYVIDGAYSCEPRKCKSVEDADYPVPDIGCGYANTAIPTPFGMVYSSKDGLVLVTAGAKFQIITSQWFDTGNWAKIKPHTVRLAYWRGYLVCVTDVVSFMLEIDGDLYGDIRLGQLTTISDKPVDMCLTDSGELVMLDRDRIYYQWDAGKTMREYTWESREFSFGGQSSPTTAKVRTQGTTFALLSPEPNLAYKRFVADEKPFRIGRLGRHLNYRVGFYGIGNVDFVDIGMATMTVNRGQ